MFYLFIFVLHSFGERQYIFIWIDMYNMCLTYLLSRCSRIDSPEDDCKDEKEYCNEHKVSDEGSI